MLPAHRRFIAETLAQNICMCVRFTTPEVGAGILLALMKPLQTYYNLLADHAEDQLPAADGVDLRPVYEQVAVPRVHMGCVIEYLCLHTASVAGEIPVDLITPDNTKTGRQVFAYIYELLASAPGLPECTGSHHFDKSPFSFTTELGEIYKENTDI
jgi:hypothetical protein